MIAATPRVTAADRSLSPSYERKGDTVTIRWRLCLRCERGTHKLRVFCSRECGRAHLAPSWRAFLQRRELDRLVAHASRLGLRVTAVWPRGWPTEP